MKLLLAVFVTVFIVSSNGFSADTIVLEPGETEIVETLEGPSKLICAYAATPVCRIVSRSQAVHLYAGDKKILSSNSRASGRTDRIERSRDLRRPYYNPRRSNRYPNRDRGYYVDQEQEFIKIKNLCLSMVRDGLCSHCQLF